MSERNPLIRLIKQQREKGDVTTLNALVAGFLNRAATINLFETQTIYVEIHREGSIVLSIGDGSGHRRHRETLSGDMPLLAQNGFAAWLYQVCNADITYHETMIELTPRWYPTLDFAYADDSGRQYEPMTLLLTGGCIVHYALRASVRAQASMSGLRGAGPWDQTPPPPRSGLNFHMDYGSGQAEVSGNYPAESLARPVPSSSVPTPQAILEFVVRHHQNLGVIEFTVARQINVKLHMLPAIRGGQAWGYHSHVFTGGVAAVNGFVTLLVRHCQFSSSDWLNSSQLFIYLHRWDSFPDQVEETEIEPPLRRRLLL